MQADVSTTRKYEGTGLGFSISKKILQLIGDNIDVESELDKGSTFIITLELEKSQLEEDLKKLIPNQPDNLNNLKDMIAADNKRNTRILLVEDMSANQRLEMIMLKKLGYSVELAINGQQAVELCNTKKFDLILMDCQMPVMDGYVATNHIRKTSIFNQNTLIIALTAHALEGDREKCLAAGMDEYISKPMTLAVLEEKIGKYLGKP